MAELKTLRLEQSGFLHAIKKSFRVIKHKASLKEKQALLEKYQQVLDTRILLRLDSHSLMETRNFHKLDHDVRNLAVALEQGNRTFARLLADQGQDLKEHIDKGFEKQAQATAENVAHKQLIESLFFPEIVSRQEQIPEAYQGTYQWIFDPPTSERVRNVRWSNFYDWLETGDGIYWISGKPGSGKSTLMKFIVHEHQTLHLLENWKKNGRLLIISFFFWRPGSDLQKSAAGLLRSLLYQIARQWPDLINHLDVQDRKTAGDVNVPINLRHLVAWTDQRLLYVLKCFLNWKPTSLWICALIDGLDEFIGEEELLLDVIRIFGSAPQCKVCVSSRPEQAFRQEFQMCSQLRVQDLNRDDMERTVAGKLSPHLQKYPALIEKYSTLESIILRKAEGVFLWLDLMIKILIRGARNEDSYETLLFRLKKTPDTINGMYIYIWESLDSVYKEESLRYFHALLAAENLDMTLLLTDLICAAGEPRERVVQFDRDYFLSDQFDLACQHEETRLVACCGGFLEIQDHSSEEAGEEGEEELEGEEDPERNESEEDENSEGEESHKEKSKDEELKKVAIIPYYNKRVGFVHRTAFDFIRDQHDGSQFYLSSSYLNAIFHLSIGMISRLVLFSLTHTLNELYQNRDLASLFLGLMSFIRETNHLKIEATDKNDERSEPLEFNPTHQVFRSLQQLYTFFHKTEQNPFADIPFVRLFAQIYDDTKVENSSFVRWCPISDRTSAAAYFGCYKYLQSRLPTQSNVDEHVPHLLQCVISGSKGYDFWYNKPSHSAIISRLLITRILLQYKFDPNILSAPRSSLKPFYNVGTLWGAVFGEIMQSCSMLCQPSTSLSDPEWLTLQSCFTDVIERFLHLGARPNTRINISIHCRYKGEKAWIVLAASPLALIGLAGLENEHFLAETQASLQSAGAAKHTDALYISAFLDERPTISYRVSKVQSEKIVDAIIPAEVLMPPVSWVSHHVFLDESAQEIIKDIMESFSKEDAIDAQTMWNEMQSLSESF